MPHRHITHPLVLSFWLLALGLLHQSVLASETTWVRVHLPERDAQARQIQSDDGLADYGSMLFGEVEKSRAAELRAQGYRIQVSDNPFLITLGEETFDPLTRAGTATERAASPDGDLHLIQFKGPIRPQWLEQLRSHGIEVVQPLHPFSYFVWASNRQLESARLHASIRWVGAMESAWKVQPEQRILSAQARPTMVMASAHGDLQRRIGELREFGNVSLVRSYGDHFVLVQIDDLPGNRYSELAMLPGIFAVQHIRPEVAQRGEMSNQSIVSNIDESGDIFPGFVSWLNDTGYDGSGITVGVVDGRVLTTHVDLADRMVSCDGTNGSCAGAGSDDHGTHVAGAIAGTGATGTLLNGFLRGQGVAPGANLVTQRYAPFTGAGPGGMVTDGMLDIYQDSARSGALHTNNSWGPTGSPQGYDIPTQQIDFISRDADPDTPGDQPILAVWSIMNGGGDGGGACAPSSLGSPDEAKNLFAVGSTALQQTNGDQVSNIFRISTNSAHGPACDGRRVPHIVAPGCNTDSTFNSANTAHSANFCGTSMASPVVSGAVAVFAEKHVAENGVNPSPALVKAIFTAAAQDLEGNPNADGTTIGHRPDRFQGYGRIDLEAVMNHGLEVYMADQQTVFTSTGDSWSIALDAVDSAQPMRIMLAWTDAPGAGLGGTTPAWVNNLDLSVETGGDTYLGNVIGPDGWSSTGGDSDDRNNLEGVFLSPAQHGGSVDITVDAIDIAGDALNPWSPGAPSQDFALVCYNCIIGDPTYTLSLDPDTLEACVPETGTVDVPVAVEIGALGAYTGTVDVTSSGEPLGVSSAFSPTSVSVPGDSTWTLTIADTAASASGTIGLNGDDGVDQNSIDLAYELDKLLATSPDLGGPADAAIDLVLQPDFTWDAIGGVENYAIQIATDAGFTNLLFDTTVAATTFVPDSELATGTEYFWRVAGNNLCGAGAWSATRSFTTRLEPLADFSATEFDMTVPADSVDSRSLDISNNGTGNLTWTVATDQLETPAGRGVIDPTLDETMNIGSFTVDGDESGGNVEEFTVPGGVLTRGTVLGFEFQGTVSGISGNSDWASDLRMIITSPLGESFDVGGFSDIINPWDFNGSESTDDGSYSSSHPTAFDPGSSDEGDWTFSFRHDWVSEDAGTMNWSDVSVTLRKAPPPYCVDPLSAVSWLAAAPDSGSVAEGGSESVSIDVDTTGLSPGSYTGYLCISTNDPNAELVPMAVELTVIENTDPLFDDRFEN